ncbi:MAG: TIGR01244 family sulfur transferase [Alphaproteobacteria bacterium]
MSFNTVTADFSAYGQVSQADLQTAADQGFKSLIINRPDGEEPGQPTAAETTAAAEALGMQVRFIPLVAGQLTPDHVAQTRAALDEMPGPILAHCRSGMRSTTLWALANKGVMSADELVELAAKAGYDLSGLRPNLG